MLTFNRCEDGISLFWFFSIAPHWKYGGRKEIIYYGSHMFSLIWSKHLSVIVWKTIVNFSLFFKQLHLLHSSLFFYQHYLLNRRVRLDHIIWHGLYTLISHTFYIIYKMHVTSFTFSKGTRENIKNYGRIEIYNYKKREWKNLNKQIIYHLLYIYLKSWNQYQKEVRIVKIEPLNLK